MSLRTFFVSTQVTQNLFCKDTDLITETKGPNAILMILLPLWGPEHLHIEVTLTNSLSSNLPTLKRKLQNA